MIGIEYASMFAALGTRVTVVEQRARLLEFCDSQVVEALQYHLRDTGVVFRFGEKVTAAEKHKGGAIVHLASGKRVPADAVLYSAGRQGATDESELELENAGLEADSRGRIAVNRAYRTKVRHIYAAGDVIGFPSLAASSMEQGRLAACDAFGVQVRSSADPMPIGIYTIPEISYVGKTEEELTAAAIPYEIGVSRYRELARGQIVGDSHGMLKLLVSSEDSTLLGVHVFGTGATELVHIGQMLMATGGTIDHLVDAVFNYPTLAESYKVAALGRDEPRPRHPPPRRLARFGPTVTTRAQPVTRGRRSATNGTSTPAPTPVPHTGVRLRHRAGVAARPATIAGRPVPEASRSATAGVGPGTVPGTEPGTVPGTRHDACRESRGSIPEAARVAASGRRYAEGWAPVPGSPAATPAGPAARPPAAR